ncbi:MAG: 4-(cytidine 5'-diphospho)-2-C-methyl-D-erythritol kinase [Micavibrio sp.]|nr:4-(cytidine 5'-diphospho)-2-C-methyl-D-erythritol kinase [Micavibrio sp.]
MSQTFIENAPAKINLYLHVTNKREDGYHNLDSLITFADFGDQITLNTSKTLSLSIDGLFAKDLSINEQSLEYSSDNILVKTLWKIADYAHQTPSFNITLTKNIPIGAGLGGGSADAAALARILCQLWDIDPSDKDFQEILFSIGADVPMCFASETCQIKNAGELIKKAPKLPSMNTVLVHPNSHCSTVKIFKINKSYSPNTVSIPDVISNQEELLSFLKTTRNDLTNAALKNTPAIKEILNALNKQDGIALSRMSGSGSACFGIFKTQNNATNAAEIIKNLHPEWWVQAVTIS